MGTPSSSGATTLITRQCKHMLLLGKIAFSPATPSTSSPSSFPPPPLLPPFSLPPLPLSSSPLPLSSSLPSSSIKGGAKVVLLIIDLVGFLAFDLVYVAAVMNYAAQSEMNIYLLSAITSLVQNKGYGDTGLDASIKVGVASTGCGVQILMVCESCCD